MGNLNSDNESLKNKFSLILFAYNLMIGYSKKNIENHPRAAFDEKKKKPGLKFVPGLALTGVRTTGPRIFHFKQISSYFKAMTAKMSDF